MGGTAHEADFSCDVTRSSGRGLSVSGAGLLGERAVLTDCDRTLWIWEECGPNSGVEGHKAKEGIEPEIIFGFGLCGAMKRIFLKTLICFQFIRNIYCHNDIFF